MSSDYVKNKFDGRINLLQIFANLINPSDVAQITTTLNVNGIIITGTMIGMKPYYEGLAEKLKETVRSTSEEIDTAIKKDLESIFEDLKQPPPLEELEKGHDFEYIHLKDAKFYVGGTFFPAGGTYWIGKIDSVDGFILGTFAPIALP
ncbi:MAG TPA: gas vesicle accessory protein GvpU [Nitrososphaeraceae archaeon]|jgi:hypothetical protein|nr:gas vesicle accessory protein GvpU [Nitrososphaeraceae archaeon]